MKKKKVIKKALKRVVKKKTVEKKIIRGGEMTAKEVMDLIKQKDVRYVDFRFIDLPGVWQHTTSPVKFFDEDTFTDGKGFDCYSIRGFQAMNEADMLLIPYQNYALI